MPIFKATKHLCMALALIWATVLGLAGLSPTYDHYSLLPTMAFAQLPEGQTTWRRDKVVVLDPGHGGPDTGAVYASGSTEKALNLSLAQEISSLLAGDCTVRLTRTGDYRLDLEERTAVANHNRADVFVSLHGGKGFHRAPAGVTVFHHHSFVTRVARDELGGRKNRWETDQDGLSWDQIQSVHEGESAQLAALVTHFVENTDLENRGVYRAPCAVLRGADMPAVLIEVGPPVQPASAEAMEGSMNRLAQAIAEAIRTFMETKEPLQP